MYIILKSTILKYGTGIKHASQVEVNLILKKTIIDIN